LANPAVAHPIPIIPATGRTVKAHPVLEPLVLKPPVVMEPQVAAVPVARARMILTVKEALLGR
jgi:hypothetical protein